MKYKVKVTEIKQMVAFAPLLEAGFQPVLENCTADTVHLVSGEMLSNEQTYKVLAALGFGSETGCKIDITEIVEPVTDPVLVINEKLMVAACYMTKGVMEQMYPENMPGECESVSELIDYLVEDGGEYAFMTAVGNLGVIAAKVAAEFDELPGVFEYEMLDDSGPILTAALGYILEKEEIPDEKEWRSVCRALIGLWVRGGSVLPFNTIIQGLESDMDIAKANIELNIHGFEVTHFSAATNEITMKRIGTE